MTLKGKIALENARIFHRGYKNRILYLVATRPFLDNDDPILGGFYEVLLHFIGHWEGSAGDCG